MVVAEPITRERDASAIAGTAVALWQRLNTILSPVLGRRGVDALYERSLILISNDYPEFTQIHSECAPTIDSPSLDAVLTQLQPARAYAAHIALTQTFHSLLVELIGTSLAEQLLDSDCDYFRARKGVSHA